MLERVLVRAADVRSERLQWRSAHAVLAQCGLSAVPIADCASQARRVQPDLPARAARLPALRSRASACGRRRLLPSPQHLRYGAHALQRRLLVAQQPPINPRSSAPLIRAFMII